MIELLKRINVTKMCESTNLNLNRIRNYMGGKIAHLTPEEQNAIIEYCHNLVNNGKRG